MRCVVPNVLLSILGVLAATAVPALAFGKETQTGNLRPDQSYTAAKSDPVTHEVDISVVVTPPYRCRVLRVWIPIPQLRCGAAGH